MRLLPRHGNVHYACASGASTVRQLAIGDKVYVNCDGRLLPVTLIAHTESRCVGKLDDDSTHRSDGECIEFTDDAIYIVQRSV